MLHSKYVFGDLTELTSLYRGGDDVLGVVVWPFHFGSGSVGALRCM